MNLDKRISNLSPVLFEVPDDEEYAKTLAGQIRKIAITQDTREGIKVLIKEVVEEVVPEEQNVGFPPSKLNIADTKEQIKKDVLEISEGYRKWGYNQAIADIKQSLERILK